METLGTICIYALIAMICLPYIGLVIILLYEAIKETKMKLENKDSIR